MPVPYFLEMPPSVTVAYVSQYVLCNEKLFMSTAWNEPPENIYLSQSRCQMIWIYGNKKLLLIAHILKNLENSFYQRMLVLVVCNITAWVIP